MAAGQGFKTFTTGEVLTAGDVNGYLMQGVLVFASAAARDAAITSPQEGQFAFTKDTNGLWYYDGAAWVASGATGDIEGVTAGIGISGGGTSGTVTITNSMATAIDAKGDLVAGTGADTFAKLTVGANGTTLVADSSEATGLKYLPFSVLQTKSVQASTQQTSTSGTYADITGQTLTITPNSATNKILIVSTNSLLASSASCDIGIRILRGATNIFTSIQGILASNTGGSFTSIYLDSPATTSATTYQVQFNRNGGSGTAYSNINTTLGNLVVMEIYA